MGVKNFVNLISWEIRTDVYVPVYKSQQFRCCMDTNIPGEALIVWSFIAILVSISQKKPAYLTYNIVLFVVANTMLFSC